MQRARAAFILFHIIVPVAALALSIMSAVIQGWDMFLPNLWRIALLLVPPAAVACAVIAVLAARNRLKPRIHGSIALGLGAALTCGILYVLQAFDTDTLVQAFAPYWLVLSIPAALALVATYLLTVRYRKLLWLNDLLSTN